MNGSSLMGLSREEYEQASAEELRSRRENARKIYLQAGADAVIDSILDLPEAIRAINEKMAKQEA